MKTITETKLNTEQACLWFIGQSGFIAKSANTTIAIDPYLSDSVAKVSPKLTRKYPPPIAPDELHVDIVVITHDHLDHLDPETISAYKHKQTTAFVGPRFVCKKLLSLGIPQTNITKVDVGESANIKDVKFEAIYAIPNEPAVADTAGYKITFSNNRNFYHTADTDLSELLMNSAPKTEVVLLCINGKWGNMNIEQAAKLAGKIKPKFAIPHHYDLMALNSENPQTFKYQLNYYHPDITVIIPEIMKPFIWQ